MGIGRGGEGERGRGQWEKDIGWKEKAAAKDDKCRPWPRECQSHPTEGMFTERTLVARDPPRADFHSRPERENDKLIIRPLFGESTVVSLYGEQEASTHLPVVIPFRHIVNVTVAEGARQSHVIRTLSYFRFRQTIFFLNSFRGFALLSPCELVLPFIRKSLPRFLEYTILHL